MKTTFKIILLALLMLGPQMADAQKRLRLADDFGRAARKSAPSYSTALRARMASYDWYKTQRKVAPPTHRPGINGRTGNTVSAPRPNGQPITTNTTTVNDLVKKSKVGRMTSGRSQQYVRQGGYTQAQKDFAALRPTNVQMKPNNVKVGELPGKRKAVLRKNSSDKRPTLEIQQEDNNSRIKFRYEGTN